jgi:hypothetical protein
MYISTSYPCTSTRYWYPVYIAKLSLLNVYLLLVNIFLLLQMVSLHCWEGPLSKHFTVSLHLFTKHVTHQTLFDLSRQSLHNNHFNIVFGMIKISLFKRMHMTTQTITSLLFLPRVNIWCLLHLLGDWLRVSHSIEPSSAPLLSC